MQTDEAHDTRLSVINNPFHDLKASENQTMVYSQAGYCLCGTEIWIEYLMSRNQWQFRFFGPDNEEIKHCPACGEALDESKLDSM